MTGIKFIYKDVLPFLNDLESEKIQLTLARAYADLVNKTGKGNDFLGWLDLPESITPNLVDEILQTAKQLRSQSEVVVVVGIGGSYLGARAVMEALKPYFASEKNNNSPQLLYAGNNISEDYLYDLIRLLEQKSFSIIVISKSGTTTEPALAFRLLKELCENKFGKSEAANRIVAITDQQRGALKKMAVTAGYKTFVIPDNVGGRYSVLTPVGLLPIAVAGFNIAKLLEGGRNMRKLLLSSDKWKDNPAMQYALCRFLLYTQQQKKIELMVTYEPKLFYFVEWYKQLFGESEGKESKGIFPAGAVFSTDLHSLGQYIQEGERLLFETVLSVEQNVHTLPIPFMEDNADGLNYLQKKSIHEINLTAEKGTRLAHLEGNVPNMTISISSISEQTLGELIFFFEFSCALGGYMLQINPFDQPGVEAYKSNMFHLLGKPK